MKVSDKIAVGFVSVGLFCLVFLFILFARPRKEPDPTKETSSTNMEWIYVPDSVCTDTIVFYPSLKGLHENTYLQLKIIGTGKAKIHAYFPSSDSTWSHYIIE